MNYVEHVDNARTAMEAAANKDGDMAAITRAVWAAARKYLDQDNLPGWVRESITHERDVICHSAKKRLLAGSEVVSHWVRMS